jgi:hypothetical protein
MLDQTPLQIALPKQWSDVTVEQFIEVAKIDKTLGAWYYNSEVLYIFTGQDIDDMDIDECTKIVSKFKWALSQPSTKYKHELLGMEVKPLAKLCLFEYIDLDYYFTENYVYNIDKICAILFRKSKLNEWDEVILEPYEYDINTRAELFLDLPITDVYGLINEFLKFRDNFLKVYANLFGEQDDELTDEEKAKLTPEEKAEEEDEKKNSKWSWERMIYGLTNNDITKSEAVGALPLTYVFNMLGMKKELDI